MPPLPPLSDRPTLQFVKVEALGNDFVVIQEAKSALPEAPALARRLCDRHRGIGADGLVLLSPEPGGALLRIYNADGSRARNCGNALRCVAQMLWTDSNHDAPQAQAAELYLRVDEGVEAVVTPRWVRGELWPVVHFDAPDFSAAAIPMTLPPDMTEPVLEQELKIGAESVCISCLSVGNPHCVIFSDTLLEQRLTRLGPRLEKASCFPERTNVELVSIRNRTRLEVLVWERGAGPTLACGTGACAAAVVARRLERTEATVTVSQPGGELEVTWFGEGLPIFLAGPARIVFEGSLPLSR